MYALIAIIIISALVTHALRPKTPKPSVATLDEFDVPTADEGKPIAVVFGEVLVKSSNVVAYGDLRAVPIKSKSGK
jgi:hypothetical protein